MNTPQDWNITLELFDGANVMWGRTVVNKPEIPSSINTTKSIYFDNLPLYIKKGLLKDNGTVDIVKLENHFLNKAWEVINGIVSIRSILNKGDNVFTLLPDNMKTALRYVVVQCIQHALMNSFIEKTTANNITTSGLTIGDNLTNIFTRGDALGKSAFASLMNSKVHLIEYDPITKTISYNGEAIVIEFKTKQLLKDVEIDTPNKDALLTRKEIIALSVTGSSKVEILISANINDLKTNYDAYIKKSATKKHTEGDVVDLQYVGKDALYLNPEVVESYVFDGNNYIIITDNVKDRDERKRIEDKLEAKLLTKANDDDVIKKDNSVDITSKGNIDYTKTPNEPNKIGTREEIANAILKASKDLKGNNATKTITELEATDTSLQNQINKLKGGGGSGGVSEKELTEKLEPLNKSIANNTKIANDNKQEISKLNKDIDTNKKAIANNTKLANDNKDKISVDNIKLNNLNNQVVKKDTLKIDDKLKVEIKTDGVYVDGKKTGGGSTPKPSSITFKDGVKVSDINSPYTKKEVDNEVAGLQGSVGKLINDLKKRIDKINIIDKNIIITENTITEIPYIVIDDIGNKQVDKSKLPFIKVYVDIEVYKDQWYTVDKNVPFLYCTYEEAIAMITFYHGNKYIYYDTYTKKFYDKPVKAEAPKEIKIVKIVEDIVKIHSPQQDVDKTLAMFDKAKLGVLTTKPVKEITKITPFNKKVLDNLGGYMQYSSGKYPKTLPDGIKLTYSVPNINVNSGGAMTITISKNGAEDKQFEIEIIVGADINTKELAQKYTSFANNTITIDGKVMTINYPVSTLYPTATKIEFSFGGYKITELGEKCFEILKTDKLNLTELSNLRIIDKGAFGGVKLSSLEIDGLKELHTIGFGAFWNAELQDLDLTFLPKLKYIKYGAFTTSPLRSIDFSNTNNIEKIDMKAFKSIQLDAIVYMEQHEWNRVIYDNRKDIFGANWERVSRSD